VDLMEHTLDRTTLENNEARDDCCPSMRRQPWSSPALLPAHRLIGSRRFEVIDDEHLDVVFLWFELESKLLLHGGEE